MATGILLLFSNLFIISEKRSPVNESAFLKDLDSRRGF